MHSSVKIDKEFFARCRYFNCRSLSILTAASWELGAAAGRPRLYLDAAAEGIVARRSKEKGYTDERQRDSLGSGTLSTLLRATPCRRPPRRPKPDRIRTPPGHPPSKSPHRPGLAHHGNPPGHVPRRPHHHHPT